MTTLKKAREDFLNAGECIENMTDWFVIDPGEWYQDNKYQYCDAIIKHKESGENVLICQTRCGYGPSDYVYFDPTFYIEKSGHE